MIENATGQSPGFRNEKNRLVTTRGVTEKIGHVGGLRDQPGQFAGLRLPWRPSARRRASLRTAPPDPASGGRFRGYPYPGGGWRSSILGDPTACPRRGFATARAELSSTPRRRRTSAPAISMVFFTAPLHSAVASPGCWRDPPSWSARSSRVRGSSASGSPFPEL